MAKRRRRARFDDASLLPPPLTPETVRSEFVAECSLPANRPFIVGKRMAPLACLKSRKAGFRDKNDAWSRIVKSLGLSEAQQVSVSGSLDLTCADVYVHPAEDTSE